MNKKKLVWWGTGNIASVLSEEYASEAPEFFIDSDPKKKHTKFMGRDVFLPEQIDDWENIKVIIVTDYDQQIYEQNREKLQRSEVYSYKEYFEKEIEISELLKQRNEFIRAIECGEDENKILFFGDVVSYDRGVCDYLNKMNKQTNNSMILFSEANFITDAYIEKKIAFPYYQLPQMFKKNYVYRGDVAAYVSQEIIEYVNAKEHLHKAAENLRLRHRDMAKNYEFLVCYYAEQCIGKLLEHFKPKVVYLWNKFYAFHLILDSICRNKSIDVRYMEFGVLPGTFAIESEGQMGESFPAVRSEEFNQLPINKQDVLEAKRVVEYIQRKDLNRNIQNDESELGIVKSKLIEKRPIIFYAGQNDFESSLQPYDAHTKKYHSPIYKSTMEGLIDLAELAKKNNWNLIFKPHPIMLKYEDIRTVIPDNVIVVYQCNINRLIDLCDVCVTILSQVSYMSVIRKKATVMLGYHQLRGSGVIYQAFSKEKVWEMIDAAIKNGFMDEQEEYLYKHIARLNKYYLYNDLTDKEVEYGRKLNTYDIL